MKISKLVVLAAWLCSTVSYAESRLTEQEIAFEKRFMQLSKIGVTLNHRATPDNQWGSPHPDAPPELAQFAFMVGHHDCIQTMTGINPQSPSQVLKGDLSWYAHYALDGRAIRDEYYSMGGNGEQTRAYDPWAKEWWVTFATVPGAVQLTPQPKPGRGSFTAIKNGDDMVMTTPATDTEGVEYIRSITFFNIRQDGFDWKSENVYTDKTINTGNISCQKTAGPGFAQSD